MESNSLIVPDNIRKAAELTQYAVRTRYLDAIDIAESTYNWAKEYLKGKGLEA